MLQVNIKEFYHPIQLLPFFKIFQEWGFLRIYQEFTQPSYAREWEFHQITLPIFYQEFIEFLKNPICFFLQLIYQGQVLQYLLYEECPIYYFFFNLSLILPTHWRKLLIKIIIIIVNFYYLKIFLKAHFSLPQRLPFFNLLIFITIIIFHFLKVILS